MSDPKTPPSNTEAERAVLGSILQDTVGRGEERVLDLCLTNGITTESFFDPRNRIVYASMLELNRNSKPLDLLTLNDELTRTEKLESIGGYGYLQSLVDQVPTSAHAEYYIKLVREKHLRRTLIERATKVVENCYNENEFPDPQVVLGDAERLFLDIDSKSTSTLPWDKAVFDSWQRIDKMFESNGNHLEGLSTGFRYLDEKLQGLKPSEMIVIAARPSVGKTSLAMNIAECAALGENIIGKPTKTDNGQKHPVGIFSLEMPVEQLTKRMIAGRAHVDIWRLNRGLIPREERILASTNLSTAADQLRRAPIYVDDTAALDVMDLRARARRWKKQHGIELIVIDYLQLCTCHSAQARQNRQIEVSIISQQIKAMAKELKIPVIILSQLSRANEQRGDPNEKPKLSDLRDSGAIEQDADVVFLLRRPSRTGGKAKDADDAKLAIVDVAKNRNGETGEVKMDFLREYTRFGDREPERGEGSKFTTSEPEPAPMPEAVQASLLDDVGDMVSGLRPQA